MQISILSLRDFRNHENLDLSFSPGATTIVGRNGRGKTNIVEAVNYLATLGSHRVSQDAPLIRNGQNSATILAQVEKHNRQAKVELTINSPGTNKVSLNANPLSKARDILGLVTTVIFSPEDLELVKGEPTARRRFIDELGTLISPKLSTARSDYERTLKQRNTLLKSLGRRSPSTQALATLYAWNEQLVQTGSEIIATRLENIKRIEPYLTEFGTAISGDTEPLHLNYANTWLPAEAREKTEISEFFKTELESRNKDEVDRGATLVGPHRDDLNLQLSNMPAKGYASHGQSWSIAIALKLAAFKILREHDDDPILILDDVFAELDEKRRERLISIISDVEQALITAAVIQDIPKGLPSNQLLLEDN
jgi:DNA replication and repair protein RecF